jgi:dihydrofolate synthase / folylpolyglutamate synthase
VNYPDSVLFLYALGNEVKTAKLGLDRIRTVLAALGHPERRCRFVHVAGTNGKGSTCAMIESALRLSGLRTGLFTSPHLSEPTERIRICGIPVTAERFAQAFDAVHATVESLLASGAIDLHTTYFETVTAMALLVFAEEAVDAVVLEVGLGGRLDATNVVAPELCVITPIDFDHEHFLGRSLEGIAQEKAGILKPGVPAVLAPQRDEAGRVLESCVAGLGIPVTRVASYPCENLEVTAEGSHFTLPCEPALSVTCPLAGEHQAVNAATAALALRALGLAPAAIEAGIAAARWPGRLERLATDPAIIVDGAHNPAGARALARYIDRFYAPLRPTIIVGVMRDKAIEEIAGILFPRAHRLILTAPRQARSLAPRTLAATASHPDARTAPTLEAAIALARSLAPANPIFITGSLYLVAEARALLCARP